MYKFSNASLRLHYTCMGGKNLVNLNLLSRQPIREVVVVVVVVLFLVDFQIIYFSITLRDFFFLGYDDGLSISVSYFR